MKVLGITGGIGSGKTLALNILKEKYNAEIIEADRLGHELMEPGRAVYNNVVSYFGRDILGKDDTIDRKKLGGIVFADKDKLRKLNGLSHPVIRDEILRIIDEGRNRGTELVVLEAALLIEEGYSSICDHMVYVYSPVEIRINRLMEYRGFDRERALAVIRSQKPEEYYRDNCDLMIDNSGDRFQTEENIRQMMVGMY